MSDVIKCPSCSRYIDSTFGATKCSYCEHDITQEELKAAETKAAETGDESAERDPEVYGFETKVFRTAGVILLLYSILIVIALVKLPVNVSRASLYPVGTNFV